MKNKNKTPDGRNFLRAKTYYHDVQTHYTDICSITAIRMALENYLDDSKEFDNPSLYLKNAIAGVNESIQHLGFILVRSEH